MPTALVIRAAGTNCDAEVCHGFQLAGATPELIHLDALIREPRRLDSADIVAFPGGFSYGDDVASGRIFAMKLRERLWPALAHAAARQCPMIGICNGFQVLVQVGLLPGPEAPALWQTDAPPAQSLALTYNAGDRYVCRWVPVAYDAKSPCIWTRRLAEFEREANAAAAHEIDAGRGEAFVQQLPVGHGEGRLVGNTPGVLDALEANGQVPIRYLDNYNGSERAIAGVCDLTGRIFGLMPHPDRFLHWNRYQSWTRLAPSIRSGDTPALRMFRNAVEAVDEIGIGHQASGIRKR
jgi:phosphoribosylformylglycinamidine synthase